MGKFKKLGNAQKTAIIIIAAAMVLAVIMTIIFALSGKKSNNNIPAPVPTATPLVIYDEQEEFVEIKKEISEEIIAEGINEMGLLVTQEYYFTEVTSYEKEKVPEVFGLSIDLFTVSSSFIVQYDGTIFAGVDFEKIIVEKAEEAGSITITLPRAEIISCEIDYDSFERFDEKNNIFYPISVDDVFDALKTDVENVQNRAIERGLLEKAAENAELIIRNFVSSLVGNDYTIIIK